MDSSEEAFSVWIQQAEGGKGGEKDEVVSTPGLFLLFSRDSQMTEKKVETNAALFIFKLYE